MFSELLTVAQADSPMSSDADLVVDARGVGKCYHIYDRPSHRLMQGLVGGSRRYYREFWALRGADLQVRRGQTVGLSGSISRYSKSIDLSFTEPYLFDHNIALGFDIYRRDYNNYNLGSSNNNTIYSQATTGFQVRLGLLLGAVTGLRGH